MRLGFRNLKACPSTASSVDGEHYSIDERWTIHRTDQHTGGPALSLDTQQ